MNEERIRTDLRHLGLFAIGVAALAACGSPDRRGERVDAGGPPPGADGGVTVDQDGGVVEPPARDGDAAADGGIPTGPVEVSCFDYQGPGLVVTRTWDGGSEGARALARVHLRFDGAATGVVIDEVARVVAGDAVARVWDGTLFTGPPGFDGTVTPRDGDPTPLVPFTAADDALAEEVELCDLAAPERDAGFFRVRGRTDQSGPFETTCSLSNRWIFDSDLRVSCARGVPGFLHGYPSFGTVSPYAIALADSDIAGYADSAAPVGGLAADSLTVRSFVEDDPFEPACAEAQSWTPASGTHVIWRGRTSEEVYTGPIAPGTEESASYMFQAPGSVPSGFCFPPDGGDTPPEDTCRRPSVQLVVSGSSSAGRWEWEGGLFTCYEL